LEECFPKGLLHIQTPEQAVENLSPGEAQVIDILLTIIVIVFNVKPLKGIKKTVDSQFSHYSLFRHMFAAYQT